MKRITIGFSIHRPEMVPKTAEIMKQYALIFLEEAPSPDFKAMLNGSISVSDYMMPLDLEYPEFSRQMCYLEKKLYQAGNYLILSCCVIK